MKKQWLLFVASAFLCGAAFADDPKELFSSEKCIKCHSVSSQNIESTNKNPDKVTDLSNTGNDITKEELGPYLRKETEHNGKTHKLKYKGDDATLQQLIDWLVTLKQ